MERFEQIKNYYDNHLWGKKAVGHAVEHSQITAEQYEQITGEAYIEDTERGLTAAEFVDILIGGEA